MAESMSRPAIVNPIRARLIEWLSIDDHEALLDDVYAERDQLVAALSKLLPAHLTTDPTMTDPEWRYVVCIHLPAGQATWHIRASELDQFDHLAAVPRIADWDGHDTDEKYARLARLMPRGDREPMVGP